MKTIKFVITLNLLMIIFINQQQSQCQTNFIKDGETENAGIQNASPNKLLHLLGNGDWSDPCNSDMAIKLEYEPQNCADKYWGHLALLTSENIDSYTFVQNRSFSDIVLQADADNSNNCNWSSDIILTSRTQNGHLRFATTFEQEGSDYERMTITPTGKIGINNTNPDGVFHVTNGSMLFEYDPSLPSIPGNPTSWSLPVEGAGTRFMWIPDKSALRAGEITQGHSDYWNNENIGDYSIAIGKDVMAEVDGGVALGSGAIAGDYQQPNAMGGIAIGTNVQAHGNYACAIGNGSQALGDYCYVIGVNSRADNTHDYAFGRNVFASGSYSVALGNYISTGSHEGSVVIGDHSLSDEEDITVASGPNQLMCRFDGSISQPAYVFWTNKDATNGVELLHGEAQWRSACDRNLKTDIETVNNYEVLNAISRIPIYTWKYKEARDNHIGPMAQDFHKEFPKLSEDSTYLTNYDLAGAGMAAIKALYSITDTLKKQNDALLNKYEVLEQKLKTLEKEIEDISGINIKKKENDDIILEQNQPNPFSETSTINYFIPNNNSTDAQVIITDINGKKIYYSYKAAVNRPDAIRISSRNMDPGVYLYCIQLNGKIIKSKKMIVLK